MASTKARTSINSATTMTAGAANVSGTWQDVNTGYGVQLGILLTNGATGPTIAAQVQIQTSNDTSHTLAVNFGGPLVGVTTNSGVSSWSIELPIGVCSFRLVTGSNTGQNVTLDSDYSTVTGI